MATSTIVSEQEYLRTSYEYDCEYVDGEVRERGLPDEYHSVIQQCLCVYFGSMKKELGVRVRPDLRVKVSARHYRIPDVTLLRQTAPFQPIPTEAPLLCVEVVSPDDRVSEQQEKIDEYVAMGVEHIWIIDPHRRTMAVADASGTRMVTEYGMAGTRVRITREMLFAEIEELAGR
jgi:Uma2 family endonuclease